MLAVPDGMSVCYLNTNLCDLHPVCDDAEDEDKKRCAEKYKEKGFFAKEAIFRCQSPHHNEEWSGSKWK